MTTFIDTSAVYALLDEDDGNHRAATTWMLGWEQNESEELVTHNYVVVEAAALVHRRLGSAAVRVLLEELMPAIDVEFVNDDLHARAEAAYVAGLRRRMSLVDRVSIQFMRDHALERAFAFDRDLSDAGFDVVP